MKIEICDDDSKSAKRRRLQPPDAKTLTTADEHKVHQLQRCSPSTATYPSPQVAPPDRRNTPRLEHASLGFPQYKEPLDICRKAPPTLHERRTPQRLMRVPMRPIPEQSCAPETLGCALDPSIAESTVEEERRGEERRGEAKRT